MRYETVKIRPWKVGSLVISRITEFGITEGKHYKIIKEDVVFPDCFVIINDTGKEESYTDEYFEMVSE